MSTAWSWERSQECVPSGPRKSRSPSARVLPLSSGPLSLQVLLLVVSSVSRGSSPEAREASPCFSHQTALPPGCCVSTSDIPQPASRGDPSRQMPVGPQHELDEAPGLSQPPEWFGKVPTPGPLGVLGCRLPGHQGETPASPRATGVRAASPRDRGAVRPHPTSLCFARIIAMKPLGDTRVWTGFQFSPHREGRPDGWLQQVARPGWEGQAEATQRERGRMSGSAGRQSLQGPRGSGLHSCL